MHNITQTRIAWLDFANVLAMIGVVWFHVPSAIEVPIRTHEYFIVNMTFFMLAGISHELTWNKLENKSIIQFILHKFRRFGIPTLCFFTLFYILWLIIGRNLAGDTEHWYEPLIELLEGRLRTIIAPYWFVFCLFTMQIIFVLIPKKLLTNHLTFLILGLTPLLCIYHNIPGYYELSQALLFIPFFAIGTVLFKPDTRLLLTIIGLIVFLALKNITTSDYLCYDWVDIVAWAIYVTFLFLISHQIPRYKTLERPIRLLRYGALILLATQNNIIGMCRVLIGRVANDADYLENNIWLKIVVFLIVYIITIPIIYFIRRYLPWMLGKSSNKLKDVR